MGRDCPTVMGERPGHCQDLSIFGCSKRILWRETTCRTPLCNATCRLLLSKQSQTPALPEVMSLSACAPDRSGFGLIFGPHCSKLGAGSQGGGGWGGVRTGIRGAREPTAASGLFFFFFNLEFTDDKKRFLLDLTEPLTSTKSADADGVGSRVALGRQWGARSTAGLGHPAAPELGRVRSGPTGTQPAARSLLPCPR